MPENGRERSIPFLPHARRSLVIAATAILGSLNAGLAIALALDGSVKTIPLVMVAGASFVLIEIAKLENWGGAALLWLAGTLTWLLMGYGLAFSRHRVGLCITLALGGYMIVSQLILLVLIFIF